jgi:ribosomal protein S2
MYCEGKHFGHNTRRWIADNRRWIMTINDAHSFTSTVICTMEPTF